MSQSLLEYCRQYGLQDVLDEWIPERNPEILPAEITYASKKKVWWRCQNGHEWQAPVHSRILRRSKCPYCTGKKLEPGKDIAALYPDIAAQWHKTRNGGLQPCEFGAGSHRVVWWMCGRGHEWEAQIRARVMGSGCPICGNKKVAVGENDLATTNPTLADEWHPTRNGPLTPQNVTYGSSKKVWWQCAKGHEWQAQVGVRVRGSYCPVCTGRKIVPGENDLASINPWLASQWDHEKNGSLRPNQVSLFSNRHVWWRCSLGHQWKATVGARAHRGNGCPVCSGKIVLKGFNDLKSQMPEVAKEWHATLNGQSTPETVTVGSHQYAWWKCSYGHVWKAVISSRTGKRKHGCPVCAGKVNQTRERYYEMVERSAYL